MVESNSSASRRRFLSATLAVAGSATAAGCSAFWDQSGATDVVAHNLSDEPKVVSITITGSGADEPHTSKTLDIPAHEDINPVNRGKLPTNRGYAVEVNVEGGPSETFDWEDPDVKRAPLHVVVDDSQNVRFLLQAG